MSPAARPTHVRFGAFPALLLGAFAFFLVATVAFAAGKERQFPAANFAITIPENWEEIADTSSQAGLAGGYCSHDQGEMVLVFRDDQTPPPGGLDDDFIAAYERKIESSGGGKRLSGQIVSVQGIKSYERIGQGSWKGSSVSTLSRTIPVQDHFLLLRAMRWNGGSADEDPVIQAIIESFRFLVPPPGATPSAPPPSTPPAPELGLAPAAKSIPVVATNEPVPAPPASESTATKKSTESSLGSVLPGAKPENDSEKPFDAAQASKDERQAMVMTFSIVGGTLVLIIFLLILVERGKARRSPLPSKSRSPRPVAPPVSAKGPAPQQAAIPQIVLPKEPVKQSPPAPTPSTPPRPAKPTPATKPATPAAAPKAPAAQPSTAKPPLAPFLMKPSARTPNPPAAMPAATAKPAPAPAPPAPVETPKVVAGKINALIPAKESPAPTRPALTPSEQSAKTAPEQPAAPKPAAQPVSAPTTPPAPAAKPSEAAPAKPPAPPPSATPDLPATPSAPPAEPKPTPFVVRPRQKHMRE
jgi:hypothetical protein